MVEFKQISDEDREFIEEMLYEMVYFPAGKTKPSKKELLAKPEIKRYYDYLWVNGAGIISLDNGEKTGAAWYSVFPDTDKGYGYVGAGIPELSVAVRPECRGKGIGTALMAELLRIAGEKGYKMISLSVDSINPAIRLYERMGFRKISLIGTSWVMVKQL